MDFLPTYSNLFLLAFICILKKLRLLLLDTVDLHHHSVTNEITCWVVCCHAVFPLSLYSGFRVQQRIQLWLCPSHKGLVVHCLSPPPPAWTLSSIQQHYTVFLLVFTCLHSMAPIYIFTLLHPFTLHGNLFTHSFRYFKVTEPSLKLKTKCKPWGKHLEIKSQWKDTSQLSICLTSLC